MYPARIDGALMPRALVACKRIANVIFFSELQEDTGGKGQYTQWVHCELIVGSETIRPVHTQQVNSGHI